LRLQYKSIHLWFLLLADLGTFALSLYLAFAMRFDLKIPPDQLANFKTALPIFIATKLIAFYLFNRYRGMWRYTSIVDLVSIIQASFSAMIVSAALWIFLFHGQGFPRTVFFTDFVFTVCLASISRVGIRVGYYIAGNNYNLISPFLYRRNSKDLKRFVLIGAGSLCDSVLHTMFGVRNANYKVVGIFDDDRSKQGTSLRGVPVVDTTDNIPQYTDLFDEIIITIPNAVPEKIRHVLDVCRKTGKKYRILPRLSEILDGKISIENAREITLSDLIGREEINNIDRSAITEFIDDKTILITGAGGSIGSELVMQCLKFKPKTLILLDISEYNLFQVEKSCPKSGSIEVLPVLADIRELNSMDFIFAKYRPQIIFHAAAYKHVPLQELQPWETILTNIQGSRNLINISKKYGVDTFVSVSTDKAVRPTSVMGATKRIVELLIQSINGSSATRFIAVRFGNVIGSSGSVIPIFLEQIKKGGPVTVTDPEIERFFMSIPEAAQLILQAGAIGVGGNIYVLKMGKRHKIKKIAEDLIRLSGLEPEKDIPIEYVGLRPGEKLFEELVDADEVVQSTAHDKIMEIQKNGQVRSDLELQINELIELVPTRDAAVLKEKLMKIIA